MSPEREERIEHEAMTIVRHGNLKLKPKQHVGPVDKLREFYHEEVARAGTPFSGDPVVASAERILKSGTKGVGTHMEADPISETYKDMKKETFPNPRLTAAEAPGSFPGQTSFATTTPIVADNGGLRYNAAKPRFDLMPPEALIALADHYRRGAEKYADRNWERGMDWGKCFASMERHAWTWMSGEDLDPETGSHHMVAVAWNALALYVYAERGIGVDDRPKLSS